MFVHCVRVCVCVYVCGYVNMRRCFWGPELVDSPGAGITGVCELLDMGAVT